MNLHIENQKLRFRIKKQELENLCKGENISQQIFLPNEQILQIKIITKNQQALLFLTYEKNSIILSVNETATKKLYTSLPSRAGIEIEQKIDNKKTLKLVFEVDIRTQKQRQKTK